MFTSLPTELNRLVGSYLDLESRINFFRVLPENDDKFVKKLDSTTHHRNVKVGEIRAKLNKIEETIGDNNKKGILLINLFNYIRKSKDTWFHKHPVLIQSMYDRMCHLGNRRCEDLQNIPSKRIRNGLLRCALMCKAKFYVTFTWEQLGITVE